MLFRSLLLELVHLERLLGTKVPEALLEGGYLEHLKEDRLDDLIERVIRARFSGMNVDDLRLGRDWLLQSLSAPSRRDYPNSTFTFFWTERPSSGR